MDMGGAPPHTDTQIRSAACRQGQIGLFKTTRQFQNALLLLSKLALQCRKDDPDGPLDSRLKTG